MVPVGDFFISDWLRNRNTVEFLGIWERVHNPDFNYGNLPQLKARSLNRIAIQQMKLLTDDPRILNLEVIEKRG